MWLYLTLDLRLLLPANATPRHVREVGRVIAGVVSGFCRSRRMRPCILRGIEEGQVRHWPHGLHLHALIGVTPVLAKLLREKIVATLLLRFDRAELPRFATWWGGKFHVITAEVAVVKSTYVAAATIPVGVSVADQAGKRVARMWGRAFASTHLRHGGKPAVSRAPRRGGKP